MLHCEACPIYGGGDARFSANELRRRYKLPNESVSAPESHRPSVPAMCFAGMGTSCVTVLGVLFYTTHQRESPAEAKQRRAAGSSPPRSDDPAAQSMLLAGMMSAVTTGLLAGFWFLRR